MPNLSKEIAPISIIFSSSGFNPVVSVSNAVKTAPGSYIEAVLKC